MEWIESLGLYASAYVFCLVGGFIPIVNAEAYFATMGAISERTALVPIVIIGTLGQMTAKTSIFLASRGAMRLPAARDSERVRRVLEKARAWRGPIEIFVFISAVVGLPPFYLVSMLGGALDLSVTRFVVIGLIGRFIRFFGIAWAAHATVG